MNYRCPKCKSTSVYYDVSIQAKRKLNGKNHIVFDVERDNFDDEYCEYAACSKCGYRNDMVKFETVGKDVGK